MHLLSGGISYGVVKVGKDDSDRITVSFPYDPDLVEKAKIASLLKSTPMSSQRVLGK